MTQTSYDGGVSRPRGYKIRLQEGRATYSCRFYHPALHRVVDRGTGESDPVRAERRAAQIYAEETGRKAPPSGDSIAELGREWLKTAYVSSQATYEVRLRHLDRFWLSVHDVDEASAEEYCAQRLGEVRRETLLKELAVLRALLRLALKKGLVPEAISP